MTCSLACVRSWAMGINRVAIWSFENMYSETECWEWCRFPKVRMPEILRELKLPMCLASNVAAASDIAQQGGMRKRGVKEERPAIAHVLPSLKAVLPTTHRQTLGMYVLRVVRSLRRNTHSCVAIGYKGKRLVGVEESRGICVLCALF